MKKLNIFFLKKSAVQHSAGYSGVILQQKFSHALRQINASSAWIIAVLGKMHSDDVALENLIPWRCMNAALVT